MQTLKNNNTRLTAALEESTQHVAEWKKQLQKYKEESDHLKKKVNTFAQQPLVQSGMSVASSHSGINYPPQVQEMETTRHSQVKVAEEMEAVKRENEELKEVLSAVQLDLEAKTEVRERKGHGRKETRNISCVLAL